MSGISEGVQGRLSPRPVGVPGIGPRSVGGQRDGQNVLGVGGWPDCHDSEERQTVTRALIRWGITLRARREPLTSGGILEEVGVQAS